MMVHHHRDGVGRGGRPNVAAERTPQRRQTFDSYPSGMAVTVGLGYPFTPVQWEEMERQAMIYKCMVANVPVPSELILPLTTDPQLSLSSGYTLKGGREDPEPGRCKRTDGKKWRCSRDAALDQKYCERHLNRGRPRSRKPVEVSVSASNKKSCHSHHLPSPSPSPCSVTTNPSSIYGVGGVAGRSSAPVFINGGFEHARSTSLFPHRESSGVDWLMIGGEPHLQHSQETLSTTPSYDNGRGNNLLNDCLFSLNSMEKQPDQNTETTRGFIDAWSDNAKHASSSTTETHEKDEEIHMGLGVTNWDYKGHPSWIGSSSWISSTQPGGPLGEVLHHRTSTPNSPSGVLQNKVGSLLDSEKASVEPEITLQWFS